MELEPQPQDPRIELVETDSGEVTLLIDGDQAVQAWEREAQALRIGGVMIHMFAKRPDSMSCSGYSSAASLWNAARFVPNPRPNTCPRRRARLTSNASSRRQSQARARHYRLQPRMAGTPNGWSRGRH